MFHDLVDSLDKSSNANHNRCGAVCEKSINSI